MRPPDPHPPFSRFDLASRPAVLAAVSGGSDSLALLLLLKSHLEAHAPATRLVAATVDHGLRAESAAEAQGVAAFAARLGIGHRILRWTGARPATGLAAAAREARYRLLAQAAKEARTDIVLTGHTMDDQAETVLMRAARRGGQPLGLAGMADLTLFCGEVWILRPLLGLRRQALRALLERHGIGWVDDPSNESPASERARVRAALGCRPDRDAEVARLCADAFEAGRKRTFLCVRAAALLERHAARAAPGLYRLAPAIASEPDRAAALHALRVLLALAGGAPRLPDAGRAQDLLGRLGGEAFRATLARALVDARRSGIWLRRETRDLPPALPLAAGEWLEWDGRWRLRADRKAEGLAIAPLGMAAARALHLHGAAPRGPALAALAAEPALWKGAVALGPAGGGAAGVLRAPLAAPYGLFAAGFDLACVRAARRLAGERNLPSAPLHDHIGPYA